MSKPETTATEILVHLVQPGVESQNFHLSEGATVADLLQASGVATANQVIFIDSVPIEETVPLTDGVIVTIGPPALRTGKPWLTPIPAFQVDNIYREYREILETHRREAVSEEEPEA